MSSFAGLKTGRSSPGACGDGVSQGGNDTDILGPVEVWSVECGVCSVRYVVCSVPYAVCINESGFWSLLHLVCSVHCTVCSVQCGVCTEQCRVCSIQDALFRV